MAAGFDKVSELAAKLRITPAAASKMVDSMVETELVRRIRTPEDRRILILKLTDKGQEILDQNKKILKENMLEGFGTLTQEEVDRLIEILTKVITHYESLK
jgi:DNA-binding MarR family transcriptional regulator